MHNIFFYATNDIHKIIDLTMKIFDMFIVFTSMLTGRLDPFLTNLTDFFIILMFSLSLYAFLGLISIGFVELIITLVSVSVIAHFSYSIIYVVNDYVDYKNDVNLSDEKFSNYKYRSLIYFKKNKFILLASVCWYSICVLLILNTIPAGLLPIISFIPVFVLLSYVRSFTTGNLRIVLLGFLRFVKYFYSIMVLNLVLFSNSYNEATLSIMFGLILPYALYDTICYKYDLRPWEFFSSNNRKKLAGLVIIFVLPLLLQTYYSLDVASYIAFGYLVIIIPGICARFLPSKILFSTKIIPVQHQNYKTYLWQLLGGLIAVLLLCIGVIFYIIGYV